MSDNQGNQIDDNVLRAFIAGKLDATQESRIAAAANQSPELIARLAEISNDGLMQRLKNSSEPLVKADVAGAESPSSLLNQGVKVAKRTGVTDVPTELATYSEYKIIKELGRGGMGVVYLAKNIRMDRLEVLKVLSERLLDHGGAKERFLREIRAVSKLNHASIVTSYSMLPLDDLMVFAMEHVHGMDLHKFIRKHTRLPIGLACSFAQQFAAGLQHAHEKGLVHRDVKPSNAIVYKADGQLQLKILDFGLAKATSEKNQSSLTQDGSMLGTPEYMSPEQALNAAKADIRADIYSLGCTLYFMLTGQPPFSGTHGEVIMAHAQRDARQVTLLRPEVPSELAAVVARMMAKDPQKRYQTPAEVHVALKPFLRSSKQLEKNVRALVAVETNTVNDLGTPSRDTSVERALPEPSLTPDHSISSELSPQQQIATLMADHRTAKGQRRRRKKGRANWFGKHLHIAMPLLGTFFVGLLWLGTLIFRTADGTIIIDNLPVDADVLVDGKRLEIIWNAGEDKAEIRVAPGTRQVEVRSKGIKVAGESVKIVANESVSMTVRITTTELSSNDDTESTSTRDSSNGLNEQRQRWNLLVETESSNESKAIEKSDAIGELATPKTVGASVESKPKAAMESDAWSVLFDGTQLDAWEVNNFKDGDWSVKDGQIVGKGHRSRIATKVKDFYNFELISEIRLTGNVNSGVMFRGDDGHVVECDLGPISGELCFFKNGRYVSKKTDKGEIVPGEWFELRIIAKQEVFEVYINGALVNRASNDSYLKPSSIDFHMWGDLGTIQIRSIKVRKLP